MPQNEIPLRMDHMAAPPTYRREFLRVERVVQNPLPELVEVRGKLRPVRGAHAPRRCSTTEGGRARRQPARLRRGADASGCVAKSATPPVARLVRARGRTRRPIDRQADGNSLAPVQVMIYQHVFAAWYFLSSVMFKSMARGVIHPHGADSAGALRASSSRFSGPSFAGWQRTRRQNWYPVARNAAFATSASLIAQNAWMEVRIQKAPPTTSDSLAASLAQYELGVNPECANIGVAQNSANRRALYSRLPRNRGSPVWPNAQSLMPDFSGLRTGRSTCRFIVTSPTRNGVSHSLSFPVSGMANARYGAAEARACRAGKPGARQLENVPNAICSRFHDYPG